MAVTINNQIIPLYPFEEEEEQSNVSVRRIDSARHVSGKPLRVLRGRLLRNRMLSQMSSVACDMRYLERERQPRPVIDNAVEAETVTEKTVPVPDGMVDNRGKRVLFDHTLFNRIYGRAFRSAPDFPKQWIPRNDYWAIYQEKQRRKVDYYPWIHNEVKRFHDGNFNTLIIMEGRTGSGKSTGALSLGDTLTRICTGKGLDIDKSVAFSAVDYLLLVNRNPEPGSWVILDEANSATGQGHTTAKHELINALKAIRFKQLNLICTLPQAKTLGDLRWDLCDFQIFCITHSSLKNLNTDRTLFTFANMQIRVRHMTQGEFFTTPEYVVPIPGTWIPKPGPRRDKEVVPVQIPFCSSDLWKKYEEKKKSWFDKFNKAGIDHIMDNRKKVRHSGNIVTVVDED